MPSWRSGNVFPIAAGILLFASLALADERAQSPSATKKAAPHRTNELTLAGLRPGRDTVKFAIARFKGPQSGKRGDTLFSWDNACRTESLFLDTEPSGKVEVIRVSTTLPKPEATASSSCKAGPPSPWRTGRGLALRDPASRVLALYGEPDSRSPSTKGGQPLELWYYAFDWAGADVPQVLEVLCSKENDGQPGRVMEITLAAPSL